MSLAFFMLHRLDPYRNCWLSLTEILDVVHAHLRAEARLRSAEAESKPHKLAIALRIGHHTPAARPDARNGGAHTLDSLDRVPGRRWAKDYRGNCCQVQEFHML